MRLFSLRAHNWYSGLLSRTKTKLNQINMYKLLVTIVVVAYQLPSKVSTLMITFCSVLLVPREEFLIYWTNAQVKESPVLDARMSDICISTSAAPTVFPAYYFTNQDDKGKVWEFNLTDGGVAANNPVLIKTIHDLVQCTWYAFLSMTIVIGE